MLCLQMCHLFPYNSIKIEVALSLSGSAFILISKSSLFWSRLVLGWMAISGLASYLIIEPASRINLAWLLSHGEAQ